MKKLFTLIVFISFFSACEKSALWHDAILIKSAFDFSTCSSDVYIKIENDTFRASLLPDFEFDTFPLDVQVKYGNERPVCNWIDIYEIKLQ